MSGSTTSSEGRRDEDVRTSCMAHLSILVARFDEDVPYVNGLDSRRAAARGCLPSPCGVFLACAPTPEPDAEAVELFEPWHCGRVAVVPPAGCARRDAGRGRRRARADTRPRSE